jgi:hypothetical protein
MVRVLCVFRCARSAAVPSSQSPSLPPLARRPPHGRPCHSRRRQAWRHARAAGVEPASGDGSVVTAGRRSCVCASQRPSRRRERAPPSAAHEHTAHRDHRAHPTQRSVPPGSDARVRRARARWATVTCPQSPRPSFHARGHPAAASARIPSQKNTHLRRARRGGGGRRSACARAGPAGQGLGGPGPAAWLGLREACAWESSFSFCFSPSEEKLVKAALVLISCPVFFFLHSIKNTQICAQPAAAPPTLSLSFLKPGEQSET